MPDLDQGGGNRQWRYQYLGPSVGYVLAPAKNVLSINSAGTFVVDANTNFVTVNALGVVINLPPTSGSSDAGAQPGAYIGAPITITDTGGTAAANPIVIVAASGDTIMGFVSIQITANHGSFTLSPQPAHRTWVTTSSP